MNTGHGVDPKTESAYIIGARQLPWRRLASVAIVILLIATFTAGYYKRTYVGLQSRDAMDMAQVAKNITLGRGFTTRFVRPLNATYFDSFRDAYPEVNRGPVYPYLVAVLFKLRAVSEQVVIWTSLLFGLAAAAATYLLGRYLFDHRVGALAAVIFALSHPVLKTAISGEEWTLSTVVFTGLLLVLALHHQRGVRHRRVGIACPCLTAVLLAILFMTNHVLWFLVIPTAVYYGVTGERRRLHLIIFMAACILTLGPWAVRNAAVTGIPVLGMTGWNMLRDTTTFPGDSFARSVAVTPPGLSKLLAFPLDSFGAFVNKLVTGCTARALDMLNLLGCLATAFAVVGTLYRFRNSHANAVRGYIYGALPLMIACFAVFSTDPHAILIFGPVAAVLASAYFLLLLDAKKLHPFFVRLLIGGLILVTALPALAATIWVVRDWPEGTDEVATILSHPIFLDAASRTPVYTDIPWTVAWKTPGVAVWLPVGDSDCQLLASASLPFNMVLLTPECEKYRPDEIWRALHSIRAWRAYVRDPDQGLKTIMDAAGLDIKRYPHARQALDRMLRRFEASQAIRGFMEVRQDPLQPDYVQLLMRTEAY